MVFNFLKKKPVKFDKDEEVEISLVTRQEGFITRIERQLAHRLFLHLPLHVQKKSIIAPEVTVLVHVARGELLGAFRSTVMEVSADENPPLFSIAIPEGILWEEVVPARFAENAAVLPLTFFCGEMEMKGTVLSATLKELTFAAPHSFSPGTVLRLAALGREEGLSCEVEVTASDTESRDGFFETTVSLSLLDSRDMECMVRALSGA